METAWAGSGQSLPALDATTMPNSYIALQRKIKTSTIPWGTVLVFRFATVSREQWQSSPGFRVMDLQWLLCRYWSAVFLILVEDSAAMARQTTKRLKTMV